MLREVLDLAGQWNAGSDRKLQQLCDLVKKTHAHDKVLVFSQLADTVRYLEGELKKRSVTQLCGVTGADENPTAVAHRFRPKSNNNTMMGEEVRVLVSTDVLSEGQDLQDAHIIVNYDSLQISVELVRRLSPDSLSVMEFKSERDIEIAEKMLRFPLLGEKIEGAWNLVLGREFHMLDDSQLLLVNKENNIPMIEEKIFGTLTTNTQSFVTG